MGQQITQDLEQRQNETLSTSKSRSRSLTLEDKIGRLILKSRLACSLPSLHPKEFALAVEAWLEVLESGLPEHRLEEIYLHAMRNKDSTFALGAPDLLKAWREIAAGERYQSVVKHPDAPCNYCDDERMEEVWIPSSGQTYKLPCFYCRSDAHQRAKVELVKKIGKPDVLEQSSKYRGRGFIERATGD